MSVFDVYLFVDWSAANAPAPGPQPNTLWLAECDRMSDAFADLHVATRREAVRIIRERLLRHVREERRVLIGFDFAYGYPAGLALALDLPLEGAVWRSIWREWSRLVTDDDRNRNNRFEAASALNQRIGQARPGPFWGCPPAAVTSFLERRSPGFPYAVDGFRSLTRLRLCEQRLAGAGIQETWKLAYPASVGSQTLTGLPYLERLRSDPDLAECSRVWPFETGFCPAPAPAAGPYILHAEIWPGIVQEQTERLRRQNPYWIRDRAQVRAMCAWARDRDRAGDLGRLFDTPRGLPPPQLAACVEEEGWILGAQ